MPNVIQKLPKISDAFNNHIKDRALEKNEWTPCPRCGSETVQPPSGAAAGGCAGASMIGCWVMMIIFVSIVTAFVFFPIAIVVFIVGLIMIPVLPAIGAAMGMSYTCKSCNFAWTFKDTEDCKNDGNTE